MLLRFVRSRLPLALCALALGCGPATDGNPDAGDDALGPDWFGLDDKLCYRFAPSGGGFHQYLVHVTADPSTIANTRTFQLRHTLNGAPQQTDWVAVTDGALVLHQRRYDRGNLISDETLSRFNPPPVLVDEFLRVDDTRETETQARVSGDGLTTVDETQTFAITVLAKEPVSVDGEALDALKLSMAVTREDPPSTQIDRWWFVPERGLVKIDPAGTAIGEMTLVRVDTDADTCIVE